MRGLYIHFPFCKKKCAYCAFYSKSGAEEYMEEYAKAVIREIKTYPSCDIDTLYFGGGTPSVLPANLLTQIFEEAAKHFSLKGTENTIEINPKTADFEKLSTLHKAGFNRVSIGVQSFLDDELSVLGRIHTGIDAQNTILDAYSAGFSNISADIMLALPNQTKEKLDITIDKMLSLPLSHISAYSLSIEEGTPFSKKELELPNEDEERELYWHTAERFKEKGFCHYEISNFAKEGREAVHNKNYWLCGEYIGIGAGAHSYFESTRYSNRESIEEYIKSSVRENVEIIDETAKEQEYYMLGLRLLEGIEEKEHKNLLKMEKAGLIERKNKKVRLTKRGIDIANYVMAELM